MPDEAVRGGESKARDMWISARKHHRRYGEYALSGCCYPNSNAEQVAEAAGSDYLPQPRMRSCRAGDLRKAGYPVENGPGHVDIKLPDPPTDEDWKNLDEVFGPPVENPVAR